MKIYVSLPLVDLTLNVEKSTIRLFVHAFQAMLELHQVVGQSALLVLNALMIRRAQIKNVLIHVPIPVATMQNVEWTIIAPFVIVWMVTLEIHSQDVTYKDVRIKYSDNQWNILFWRSWYFWLAPVFPVQDELYRDPCNPSPCGPLSECRNINGGSSCACLSTYIGAPPNCRPECSINSECPSNQACINEKCRDPCPGSCGLNAICNIINHTPVCTCSEYETGDPFTICSPKLPPSKNFMFHAITSFKPCFLAREPEHDDPCYPPPCGSNTKCMNGICSCLPEYEGDPYTGCRPECVINNDCSRDKACVRNKCVGPCPGTCGVNAICEVSNHIPLCSCPQGMIGNAFIQCAPYQCMYKYVTLSIIT